MITIKVGDPFFSPSQAWDFNADIIDLSVADVTVPTNGILRNTLNDGTFIDNAMGYTQDFVISGLTLSIQASPNALTIDYVDGTYQIGISQYSITPAGFLAVNAGDLLFPRIDIVYVDTLNAINYLVGTASANPVIPATPANTLLIGIVYVNANATTLSETAFITEVDKPIISAGMSDGQIPIWNTGSRLWVPTSSILVDSSANTGLGTAPLLERLTLDGAIEFIPMAPPGVTLNKLYVDTGNLFFDGIQLNTGTTIAAGTTVNSLLKWDGFSWVEDTTTLLSLTSLSLSTKSLYLDNIAGAPVPATGFYLYSNANDVYLQTPTKNIALSLNGGLPSASPGDMLYFNSGWQSTSDVVNLSSFIVTKNVLLKTGTLNISETSTTLGYIDNLVGNTLTLNSLLIDVSGYNGFNASNFSLNTLAGSFNLSINTPLTSFAQSLDNATSIYVFTQNLGGNYFTHNIDTSLGISDFGMTDGVNDSKLLFNCNGDFTINSITLGFFNTTPVVQASPLTAIDASAPNTGDVSTDNLIINMRTRINEIETLLTLYGLIL